MGKTPKPKPPKQIGRLTKPDYVKYKTPGKKDDTDSIENLFCKGCGDVIAMITDRPVDGDLSNPRTKKVLTRLANYVEAKFKFDDGHYHVTNGCKKCLNMSTDMKLAQGMVEADLIEMDLPETDASVVAIVAIDTTGAGLI